MLKRFNIVLKICLFNLFFLLVLGKKSHLQISCSTSTVQKKLIRQSSYRIEIQQNSFYVQNQQRVTATASWLLFHPLGWWQSLNAEGNCVDVVRSYTAYLIVLSWLFPCGNVWICSVAQMSYVLLNECDCDKLGC